jgi:hypothetical protein
MSHTLICMLVVVVAALLLLTSIKSVDGLFFSGNGDTAAFPHAHSYKSHAWEEYNLGSLDQLDVQFKAAGQEEPSHIHLCRALLDDTPIINPNDAVNDNNAEAATQKQTIVVVDEEDAVCQDGRNSYKSLWTMFASSLISHVAHIKGKTHIFYEHSCGTNMAVAHPDPKSWMDVATIQQFLPPFLKMGLSQTEEQVLVPMVSQACAVCMEEYALVVERDGTQQTLENKRFPRCLLFPQTESKGVYDSQVADVDPIRHLRHAPNSSKRGLVKDAALAHEDHVHIEIVKGLIPALKNNLRQAAEEWRSTRHLSLIQDNWVGSDMSSMRGKNGFTEQRSLGTIIYLDCAHGDCSIPDATALAMPLYVYAAEIPRSAHAVEIIVTHSCAVDVGGCGNHGVVLKDFLQQYLPEEASVTLEQFEGNSGTLYARMMLAGSLIAPPTLSVMIPILAKSHQSTMLNTPDLFPWMDELMALQHSHKLSHGQSLEGIHYFSNPPSLLKSPFHESAIKEFLQTPMNDSLRAEECRDVRGRYGHWELGNTEYIQQAQYVTPIMGYAGNADVAWKPMMGATLENGPYRDATTYRWVDYFEESCPVHVMNRESLCKTLGDLNIQRVMFVGDSLAFHWSQAFWKVLGGEETPGSDTTLTWNLTLQCPTPEQSIKFIFVRNDRLDDITGTVEYGVSNCGGFSYCHPWRNRYASQPEPTLLIANTGAHQYDPEEYKADVDGFVEFVRGANRLDDIILMRNTVPGHPKCHDIILPFDNVDQVKENADYSERPYSIFNWHMFPMFNRYMDDVIHQHKEKRNIGYGEIKAVNDTATTEAPTADHQNSNRKVVQIELLDVYPMTSLRPDGHIASVENLVEQFLESDKCKGCAPQKKTWAEDCLHYSLPGPIDWWSHLLFSTIEDIAAQRKQQEQS